MGVLPALQEAGFPGNSARSSELGNGSLGTALRFRQGKYNREPEAIQVERARFDHILLKHARAPVPTCARDGRCSDSRRMPTA